MTTRPLALFLPTCLALACNQPPEGLQFTLGPEDATTSDDLVVQVIQEAVDPNSRDEVLLATTWLKDGVVVEDLTDVLVVPAARTARGERWTVEVTATDGRKDAAPLEASLIIANTAPTAELTVPKGTALTTEDLTASATGADLDGDDVTILWSWTVDGVDANVPAATVPADRTRKGQTWRVTATPSDGLSQGEGVSAEIVIANTVPSVGAARVDPARVYETTIANCRGGGWRDADGDPERYEVTWYVNGSEVLQAPTIDGTLFDRGDKLSCGLIPIDDESAGESVRGAAVDVRNSLAIPTGAELLPEEATVTSTLETRVTGVYDADGDFAVVRYTWFVDDVRLDGVESSFLRPLDHGIEKGQEVTVWMRGYDGIEIGDGPARSVTLDNTPPSAPEIAVEVTSEHVHCAVLVDATDPDVSDVVSYTVDWTVDGVAWTGGTVSLDHPDDAIARTDTAPGERWECTVTPSDGEDAGTPAVADETLAAD